MENLSVLESRNHPHYEYINNTYILWISSAYIFDALLLLSHIRSEKYNIMLYCIKKGISNY